MIHQSFRYGSEINSILVKLVKKIYTIKGNFIWRSNMRINKFLAQRGISSRRKADELVANGNVKVNGATIRELGYQVGEDDVVEVNGNRVFQEEKKVYFLMNKPLGYVTTMQDDKGRASVADLITDIHQRVFPIGRLDYNTSGLLLITNDGELSYRLTHPKHKVTKTYRALVKGYVSDTKLAQLRRGVDIGGFITSKARVSVIKQMKNLTLIEIEIHEGKNRQVRKMFNAVGHPVQELERIAMGNIKLGRILQGHYRKLSPREIEEIKSW